MTSDKMPVQIARCNVLEFCRNDKSGSGMWLHGVVKDNRLSHRVLNKPVTSEDSWIKHELCSDFSFLKIVLLRAEKNTNSEYYID